jgi:hypothetical protein
MEVGKVNNYKFAIRCDGARFTLGLPIDTPLNELCDLDKPSFRLSSCLRHKTGDNKTFDVVTDKR